MTLEPIDLQVNIASASTIGKQEHVHNMRNENNLAFQGDQQKIIDEQHAEEINRKEQTENSSIDPEKDRYGHSRDHDSQKNKRKKTDSNSDEIPTCDSDPDLGTIIDMQV